MERYRKLCIGVAGAIMGLSLLFPTAVSALDVTTNCGMTALDSQTFMADAKTAYQNSPNPSNIAYPAYSDQVSAVVAHVITDGYHSNSQDVLPAGNYLLVIPADNDTITMTQWDGGNYRFQVNGEFNKYIWAVALDSTGTPTTGTYSAAAVHITESPFTLGEVDCVAYTTNEVTTADNLTLEHTWPYEPDTARFTNTTFTYANAPSGGTGGTGGGDTGSGDGGDTGTMTPADTDITMRDEKLIALGLASLLGWWTVKQFRWQNGS